MLLLHNLSYHSLHQMESAICLRYSPFPYGSKGLQATRPSRFHLKFNHATPLCVPQFSTTTHPVTRSFRHANCMLEGFSVPSENERKSGNKILRGVTAVSLVLACVLGLFNFSGKMNPKFNTAYAWPLGHGKPKHMFDSSNGKPEPKFDLSKIGSNGPDGRSALKSLLVMSKAEPSTDQNHTPIDVPDENEVKNLKLLAIGNHDDALTKLEKYYQKYKSDAQAKEYMEVALVEVFMFKGIFEVARNLLDQQIDELIKTLPRKERDAKKPKWDKLLDCYHSDSEMGPTKLGIAQRILYKAIVQTMLDDEKANEEAKEWWQAFISLPPVLYKKKK